MEFLFLAVGLIIGFFIAWLFLKNKVEKSTNNIKHEIIELDKEKEVLKANVSQAEQQIKRFEDIIENYRKKTEDLNTQIATLTVEKRTSDEKLTEYKKEIEKIQEKFRNEFENLANKILEEKTKKFTDQNKINISEILNPLKEKIKNFEEKVEKTYEKELRDTISLKEEVKQLFELNQRISKEANNLTNALKGDVKKMGNWGEVVLERILERSGLIKGQEYDVQHNVRNEQGSQMFLDVLVKLPDNKHIVIDSKVSLVAYEKHVNAESKEEKDKYLKLHIDSIKRHVDGLSEKNYQNVASIDSPDFVLLFIPMESSFSIAIQYDLELFNYSWDKKIVIVSPSTLLATLKTVESIWKHEKQTKNAIEIARQGGSLYDKFASFLEDLEKIGKQLNTVNMTYEDAHKKLVSGKGNLLGRVENLKKLGAKTKLSKSISDKYLFSNDENIETE